MTASGAPGSRACRCTRAAPPWLFGRMVRLAREVLAHLVAEYGPEEVLRRLSDPVLVPGVRLRARLRLALERRHHHGVRRAQGGGARPPGGLRPVRRRRQGRRRAGRRPRSRLPARFCRSRRSRWSSEQGSPPKWTTPRCRMAISCTTTPSCSRRPAAGAWCSRACRTHAHRAPLPLAERRPRELRRRAARGGVLRCAGAQLNMVARRALRRAAVTELAAQPPQELLAVRAGAQPVHAAAPSGRRSRTLTPAACTRSCSGPTSSRPRTSRACSAPPGSGRRACARWRSPPR